MFFQISALHFGTVMLGQFSGTLYLFCNVINFSSSLLITNILLAIDGSLPLFKGFPITSLTNIS